MRHLRYVPTLTHGLLDHLLGMIMIVSPWVFEYHTVRGPAVHVPLALGAMLIVSSLFTKYEMGLIKLLPIKFHLWLDVAIGVGFAASPWIFGFADRIFLPHLLGGFALAILPLFSERKPFDESLFTEIVIRDGCAEVVRYARSKDRSL